jgi:RES domain
MTPKMVLPKRLPVRCVRVGTHWMRINLQGRNALWFGPLAGHSPIHRFDDPAGQFRVCYLGTNLEVCFAETFLRNPPVTILALDDLSARNVATVEVRREMRLVPLHGSSLARLGTTAEVASGGDYEISQLWSRALWEHRNQPDGIVYRSRHDDSAFCIALYDRAKDGLSVLDEVSLAENPQRLAKLLRRYRLGLTI